MRRYLSRGMLYSYAVTSLYTLMRAVKPWNNTMPNSVSPHCVYIISVVINCYIEAL